MAGPPTSTAVAATTGAVGKVMRFLLREDTEIVVVSHYNYPMWFYLIIAVGFVFCLISCGIWFICAICRLKQEKPCTHALYEAHIVTEDATGDKGIKSEKAKHSKKVEAMSEAESLAKSFKSVRSKKSSRRSSRNDEEDKSKTSRKSKRNDGGKDCVIHMEL